MKPRLVDKPLILYGKGPLILYGKGQLGKLAEEIFKELGIEIYRIIDKNSDLSFDAIPIGSCIVAVCVATEPLEGIRRHLERWGFRDIFPVWDILEAYADKTGIHNGWFAGDITEADFDGIAYVLYGFADVASRTNYGAHLDWRVRRQERVLPNMAYEPLPSTLADIRKRQGLHVFNAIGGAIPKKISIHAEGFEYETIRHNLHLLKEWRPKIDVACYHSRDGLWKIQKILMDNLENYTFKFRLHAYQGQGAVLYCEPKGGEADG